MTNKHDGFTLIELLVVIAMLGILAMLVIPNALSVYENARVEAFKTGVKSISKSIEKYVFENDNFPEEGINVSDLNITNKESYTGKFIKNENGNIEAEKISNGRYCASGEIDNLLIEKNCSELDPTAPTNTSIIISEQLTNSIRVVGSAIDVESGITKYEFKINDGEYIDKGSINYHVFTGLTAGTYTIHLRVTNGKGLTSETNTIITLSTLTAPTYSISPAGWSISKTVTITYPTREANFVYSYSTDNGTTWIEVPTGTTASVVFNTNGTVIGKVYDGTTTVTSTQTVSQIDTTEAIVSLSEQSKTSSSVSVLASATDTETGITKYEFKIDSESYINNGSTPTYTFNNLTSGNHTVYVRVTNGVGLIKEISKTIVLTTLVAPTYTVSPSGWATSKTVTITYPARQTGFIYSYSTDGGDTWTEVSTGTTANVVFNANGTLIGKVSDGTNTITSSQTVSQIDNTSPIVTFETNGNSTYAKSRSTIVTVTDNVSVNTNSLKYQWTTSATAPTQASFTTTFTNSSTINSTAEVSGTYYLWVLAEDITGNATTARSNLFNLDNTPPVITLVGDNPVNIYVGDTYTEAGITAIDTFPCCNEWSGNYATGTVNTNVAGSYTVTYSLADSAGNTSIATRTVNVLSPNYAGPGYVASKGINGPVLATGMTPIKWNGSTWVDTTTSDSTWYNYTTANKQWANARTADGSMWVWIPRYAYYISSGYHTNTAGTINIKFLQGTTNTTSDGTTIYTDSSTSTHYSKHPAFTFGTTEIAGMWVAKFEMSGTTSSLDSKPNVATLTLVGTNGIDDMFISSRNMETNSKYGWGLASGLNTSTGVFTSDTNNVDTHMMKNTEWGAVAYLAHSTYGQNSEIFINPSSGFITGRGGRTESQASTIDTDATVYSYDGKPCATKTGYVCTGTAQTVYGMTSSTTGNIYGIYDMSGGAYEIVMGNYNNIPASSGLTPSSINSKYINIYSTTGSGYDESNYGDAVYETSASGIDNTSSWYSDYSVIVTTAHPWFSRGGSHVNGVNAGVFSFRPESVAAHSWRSIVLVGSGL